MSNAASITEGRDIKLTATSILNAVFEHGVKVALAPLLGILAFLMIWSLAAQNINTSLGQFPGPTDVWQQFGSLYNEHKAERAKATAFYERQEKRNAARVAKDPTYVPKIRAYTGKETYFDQIVTSLITVMSGFILAALVAIPLGIAVGLNSALRSGFNPIIQSIDQHGPEAAERYRDHGVQK